MPSIKFFTYQYSGHCHRVEWFLKILNLPYEKFEVNLRQGEHKSESFLRMNPFGQVPVIQDGENAIGDSNAILVYLAQRYAPDWLPSDPIKAADLQRWFSVAAGLVAYGPAHARAIKLFARPDNLQIAQTRTELFFKQLEQHLQQQKFLLGNEVSLADIANYAYIARAPEGGVDFAPYPNISAWLSRLEASQSFLPMPIFVQKV